MYTYWIDSIISILPITLQRIYKQFAKLFVSFIQPVTSLNVIEIQNFEYSSKIKFYSTNINWLRNTGSVDGVKFIQLYY